MEILYLCLVSFLAGLVQGFSGFGSVLLSLPLLALFLDVKIAVPLMALSAMALTLYLLASLWRHLDWDKILPLLIGSLFGVPVGVFVLKELREDVLLILLGVILVAYALYSLIARPYRQGLEKHWAYPFGFLAGCMGGAFTASGPPVIVYTSLQPWSKDEIKVTLQGYFFVSGILVILFQALGGLMTEKVIRYFLISLPPILLGTWAGHFFSGRVREETYRRFMLILLGCLGAFTVWKSM